MKIFNMKKGVVIITGASRGLGRAIALKYGREGWSVLINYLAQKEAAENVAKKIKMLDSEAVAYKGDVSNIKDVANMIDTVMKKWNKIDALVNNAGIVRDSLLIKMSGDDWDSVIDTNLKGAFNCIREASKIFIQQKKGHIINIASIVGLQGRIGQANYSAAKAGLIGLTKAAAIELGEYNVKVNAVIPGYMKTEMGGILSDKMKDEIIARNVLQRASNPAEVADFIFHLSTTEDISGQVFNLDSRII